MWEAIESNSRRSRNLICLMGALLVGLGFVIGMTIEPGLGGAIGAGVALLLWLILLAVALLGGDKVLLSSAGARTISKEDAPQLWNVVEEMTLASGLSKMPRVCIIEDDAPNAFACGRKAETSAIAVTSGLLKRLNRDELQGVVAHEIAHIRNHDVRFLTIATVMVGSIAMISEVFLRSLWFGGGRRRTSSSGGGHAQIVIFLVAILAAILAPIAARLLYFACSRSREYLADASAARFTRYPDGLASALEKIAAKPRAKREVNRILAPLYIVNPLQGLSAVSVFATHPPINKRVGILRSMGGRAGLADYEAAYLKTIGGDRGCIGQRTLAADESVEARPPTPEPDKRKEGIARAREVGDLLGRLGDYLLMPCLCGVRIKVPSNFKRQAVKCPKCGRKHGVPKTEEAAKGKKQRGERREASRYERKLKGWESFKCSCGRTNQLSPSFKASFVECVGCQRRIEIVDS